MSIEEFLYKAKAYLHRKIVINSKGKWWYLWLYPSYWHYRFGRRSKKAECKQYISSRPNPGAGIGHQIANWLSGYKIADYYGKQFATYPFSYLKEPFVPNEWDEFLGLNNNEISVRELLGIGYKCVLMPRMDFDNETEKKLIGNIISSYAGKKVVFLLEMDQFAGNELKFLDFMRKKYYASAQRGQDRLIFEQDSFNVAVHIRRGDIVQTGEKKRDCLTMRWLDVEYYQNVLDKYLNVYAADKEVAIYIFSQADAEELGGFEKYGQVHYCNDMNAINSFLHMVNADMLVMSRSGMSYQAAKLNLNGIIIYPDGFWREPVQSDNWILD